MKITSSFHAVIFQAFILNILKISINVIILYTNMVLLFVSALNVLLTDTVICIMVAAASYTLDIIDINQYLKH